MPSTDVNQGAEIKPKARGGEAAGDSSCGTKSCSRRPKVQMFCQEEVEPGPWLAEHIVLFFFRRCQVGGFGWKQSTLYQFVSHFCLNLFKVFISMVFLHFVGETW